MGPKQQELGATIWDACTISVCLDERYLWHLRCLAEGMRLHPIVLCVTLALFGCATSSTSQSRVVAASSTLDASWTPPEAEELMINDRPAPKQTTYSYRLYEPNRREQTGHLHAAR